MKDTLIIFGSITLWALAIFLAWFLLRDNPAELRQFDESRRCHIEQEYK